MITCTDFHGQPHQVEESDLIQRQSAYGVYITDRTVLLVLDPRSLRWELPGGGVEHGESVRQGLEREFFEETGLHIGGQLTPIREWVECFYDLPTNQAWRATRQFYKIEHVRGALRTGGNGDDSQEARLVALDELANISITEPVKNVIMGL